VLAVGKRSVERRGWSLPISKLLWLREDVEALPKRLRMPGILVARKELKPPPEIGTVESLLILGRRLCSQAI
jgi:hypothetical protein